MRLLPSTKDHPARKETSCIDPGIDSNPVSYHRKCYALKTDYSAERQILIFDKRKKKKKQSDGMNIYLNKKLKTCFGSTVRRKTCVHRIITHYAIMTINGAQRAMTRFVPV